MHFPGLEVCCDWSMLFTVNLADVSGAGTCVETLTMTAWDAMGEHETDSLNLDLIEILKTSYLSILGTAALI